jgi:hypothetical protein
VKFLYTPSVPFYLSPASLKIIFTCHHLVQK